MMKHIFGKCSTIIPFDDTYIYIYIMKHNINSGRIYYIKADEPHKVCQISDSDIIQFDIGSIGMKCHQFICHVMCIFLLLS